ncbi:MAG TPA: hypothetical protein VGC18_02325 [Lacisediminihabitans sp.]|uniref:hypothetical protein n=1 Tax=Lacisediminihabitans sp. TaxID=2787631 RepID=UPI002EDA5D33
MALISVLVVLCAGFAALDYVQGPKLSTATVDTSQAVAQADQQLRLFANQNVSAVRKSQVTITPATPFSVSAGGQVISVQFSERLRYATRYTVRVAGVTSLYQDRPQTFRYSFTTGAARVYYLDRADPAAGGGQPDTILRTSLGDTGRTIVYSAPRIQQFVVYARVIVVSSLNDDNTSSLSIVSLSGGPVERVQLPEPGVVDDLQVAPQTGIVGFEFTGSGEGAGYSGDLMTLDLAGAHTVQPVLGIDSRSLAVLAWAFIGSSTSLVAQAEDRTMLLIDAKKPGSVTPLRQYAELDGVCPDGTAIVVGDALGNKLVSSLKDGAQTYLPTRPLGGATTYGGKVAILGTGTDRVQQVAVFDPDHPGAFASYLVSERGATSRILFQTVDNKGSIDDFRVSPNGQYVAVTVIPDVSSSVSDGYSVDAQSTSVSTVFVDVATGAVVRSVDGFDATW